MASKLASSLLTFNVFKSCRRLLLFRQATAVGFSETTPFQGYSGFGLSPTIPSWALLQQVFTSQVPLHHPINSISILKQNFVGIKI